MAIYPSNQVVVQAWLKSLDGIPDTKVATTLPKNQEGGVSNEIIAPSGFITVNAMPSTPHTHLPQKQVNYQMETWAVNTDSQKIPWGKANNLAEIVWHALYDQSNFGHLATPVQFDNVRVMSGLPLSEPTPMEADDGRMAVFMMEFYLVWVRAV